MPLRNRLAFVAERARWVVLDGTEAESRARDLDRSARRDLASTLRRLELRLAGIDLWIPERHLAEPGHADRASAAVTDALGLAGDLARLVGDGSRATVSIRTPPTPVAGVFEVLSAAAERHGAFLADAAEDGPRTAHAAVDPTPLLLAGGDPAARVSELGERCVQARLSDAGQSGPVYVGSGSGRIDVSLYAAAIVTAGEPLSSSPVVLDARGLRDGGRAIAMGTSAWRGAFGSVLGAHES